MTLKFYRHLFTSSKSRGGYRTFQESEGLTENQKGNLQMLSKIDAQTIMYLNLRGPIISLEGNQIFHLKFDNLTFFGSSFYLGKEIHTNEQREGNYISDSLLLKETQELNFNPALLFENFQWKKNINPNEDTIATPVIIPLKEYEYTTPFDLQNFQAYFNYLKNDKHRLEIFAKIIDFLIEKGISEKIIVIDKNDNLRHWAISVLLCFPEKLANRITFVSELKNKILPNFCNLIFTESESIVPEEISAFVFDTANYISTNHQARNLYTKKIIEAINNNNIKEWLREVFTYIDLNPVLQFSKELNRAAEFFDFFDRNQDNIQDNFRIFLEAYIPRNLTNSQFRFYSESIFEFTQKLKIQNNEKGLEFLLFLSDKYSDNQEIKSKFIEKFYTSKGNLPFVDATIVKYIAHQLYKFNSIEKIEDLLSYLKNSVSKTISNNSIREVINLVAKQILNDPYKPYFFQNYSKFEKLIEEYGNYFVSDIMLDEYQSKLPKIKAKIEKLKKEKIDWGIFLEILENESLDWFGDGRTAFLKIISESIPKVSIDDSINNPQIDFVYKRLTELSATHIFYGKLIEQTTLSNIQKLLDNHLSENDKINTYRQIDPKAKNEIENSNLFSNNKFFKDIVLKAKLYYGISGLLEVLNEHNKFKKKYEEVIGIYIETIDKQEDKLPLYINLLENYIYGVVNINNKALQVIVSEIHKFYLNPRNNRIRLKSLFKKLHSKNDYPFNTIQEIQSIKGIRSMEIFFQKIDINQLEIHDFLDFINIEKDNNFWMVLLGFLYNKSNNNYFATEIITWLHSNNNPIVFTELIISCIADNFKFMFIALDKDLIMRNEMKNLSSDSIQLIKESVNNPKNGMLIYLLEMRKGTVNRFFSNIFNFGN